MNSHVAVSAAIAFLVACFVAVKADGDCFDMEKYNKDAEEQMAGKKMMITALTNSCAGKENENECKKNKVLNVISPTFIKNEAKKYIKDESKIAPFNSLIDDCYKDKSNFFKCYAEKIVALCPETKAAVEDVKKDHPSFFE